MKEAKTNKTGKRLIRNQLPILENESFNDKLAINKLRKGSLNQSQPPFSEENDTEFSSDEPKQVKIILNMNII